MPVHTNKIGTHEFVDLAGTVFLRQQQLESIERAGINGTGFRKLGLRGRPFELFSVSFHADFDAAQAALAEYATLVDDDPQTVIQNSVDWGTYKVLEVSAAEPPHAVVNVIGSANPDDEARMVTRWVLMG